MRARSLCVVLTIYVLAISASAQKQYGWVSGIKSQYQLGNGAALTLSLPIDWWAKRIHFHLTSGSPVSLGFVSTNDIAIANARHLGLADLLNASECARFQVTDVEVDCQPSILDTQIVIGDSRNPIVSWLAAAALVKYAGDVQGAVSQVQAGVVSLDWMTVGCVANCDQPDPPVYGWATLAKSKLSMPPGRFAIYQLPIGVSPGDQLAIEIKAHEASGFALIPLQKLRDLISGGQNLTLEDGLAYASCVSRGQKKLKSQCAVATDDTRLLVWTEMPRTASTDFSEKITRYGCVQNCR